VEIDVVALSPAPSQSSYNSTQNEKKYFCQRCLNHDLQFPRKGHKPVCKYASCTCSDCIMVEQRRQLNNMLSKSKMVESPRETVNGRRIRDPQCARCRQHGIRVPLRGHKRVLCQFANCKCEMVSPSPHITAELPHPVPVYPCAAAPPALTPPIAMVLPQPVVHLIPTMPNPFMFPLPFFNMLHQLSQQMH
ncbi:DM DNA binding domain protein, partial [Teladorsagia circumcincta]